MQQDRPLLTLACATQYRLEPRERRVDVASRDLEDAIRRHAPWVVPTGPYLFSAFGAGRWQAQGWKLHVTATPLNAVDVVHCCLPILLSRGVRFKVVGRVADLLDLNGGRFGQSQVGKFLTVYPSSDMEAVELAVGLHEATIGLSGPAVASDRPLREDTTVFYRYGAFRDVVGAGPQAEVLMDPEGRLESDPRFPFFAPPSWASDPFIAAGSATPDPEDRGAFLGRFLILGALNRSVWGRVYDVIDLDARPPARRVLKQVWHDVAMDEYGRDSRDHAAMEASVLASLPPRGPMPQLYDVIDTGKDLFLVMEELQGPCLGDSGSGLPALGTWSTQDVMELAVNLARSLKDLHDNRVVHRDVKPANMLVQPDGGIRLVDAAFAYRLGLDSGPPLGFGTTGFVDPLRDFDRPRPSDDVYGWAATTYLVATGEMPGDSPKYRQLGRARRDLPEALSRVVDETLTADEGRPRDFRVVSKRLSVSIRSGDPEAIKTLDGVPEARVVSWAEGARRATRELVSRCKDASGRPIWEASATSASLSSPSLYDGVAGVGLALSLAAEDSDEEARALVERAASWLCGPAHGHGSANSGLYGGDSGIGLFLLRHATVGGSSAFMSMAIARARRLALPEPGIDDLVDGTAGALLFLVPLAQVTADGKRREQVETFADALLNRAIEHHPSGGLFWLVRGRTPAERLAYLGLLHGTAGIGLALLQAGVLLERNDYLNAAAAAARTLIASKEVRHGDDGLESRWPRRLGDSRMAASAHCHGAGGISQFLIMLWKVTGNREWLDEAVAGGRAVAARVPMDPTLCHGALGDAALLVDLAQATGAAAFLRLAEQRTAEATNLYGKRTPEDRPPGLMLGTAGLALTTKRFVAENSGADPVLGGIVSSP